MYINYYHKAFAIVVPLAIALVVLALPFVPLGWRITQATIVFCPALVAALHILYRAFSLPLGHGAY